MDRMVSIHRSLPPLSNLYVCNDEAFGERYKVVKYKYKKKVVPAGNNLFFMLTSIICDYLSNYPEWL